MEILNLSTANPKSALIDIEGDIDMYSSQDFQRAIDSELETGKNRILIDFGKVDYLDSSGVGSLIRMLQKAKTKGSLIAIKGLHGAPLKVMQLSHILSLVKAFENELDAETFLRG